MHTLRSPRVDVIIITFNGIKHIERCLRALELTTYPNYRVVLVDNGSSDGSAEFVADHFPACQIIRTGKNLGFAGGNNVALRGSLQSKTDFVVLLNDDAYVQDPEWLTKAVDAALADPSVGMVGFDVIQGRGVDDSLGSPRTRNSVQSRPISRIDGCSLFIRTGLLEAVGLLDEKYFMYAEEDDLELRAGAAGYSLVEINSVIYHIGGSTSKRYPTKMSYYQSRNYLRFALKNLNVMRVARRVFTMVDILCNPFPLVYRKEDVAHVRMRGTGSLLMNAGIYLAALTWNVVHLPETLLLRFRSGAISHS